MLRLPTASPSGASFPTHHPRLSSRRLPLLSPPRRRPTLLSLSRGPSSVCLSPAAISSHLVAVTACPPWWLLRLFLSRRPHPGLHTQIPSSLFNISLGSPLGTPTVAYPETNSRQSPASAPACPSSFSCVRKGSPILLVARARSLGIILPSFLSHPPLPPHQMITAGSWKCSWNPTAAPPSHTPWCSPPSPPLGPSWSRCSRACPLQPVLIPAAGAVLSKKSLRVTLPLKSLSWLLIWDQKLTGP